MKIRYKTFKTREGTFLEVYGSSLDIMKVDALAKKRGFMQETTFTITLVML